MRELAREVRRRWRDWQRNRRLRAILKDPSHPDFMKRLIDAWANPGWAAHVEYLAAVRDVAVAARQPILECGSGVTTLLMAAVATVPIVSLEHHPEWAARVRAALRACGLSGAVTILERPLVNYGAYDWYSMEGLQNRGPFSAVICDGPPGETLGGRIGLQAARELLLPGCRVLLDDAERVSEQEILREWGWPYETHANADQHAYASVVVR